MFDLPGATQRESLKSLVIASSLLFLISFEATAVQLCLEYFSFLSPPDDDPIHGGRTPNSTLDGCEKKQRGFWFHSLYNGRGWRWISWHGTS